MRSERNIGRAARSSGRHHGALLLMAALTVGMACAPRTSPACSPPGVTDAVVMVGSYGMLDHEGLNSIYYSALADDGTFRTFIF